MYTAYMRNISREEKHICPSKHALGSVFLSIEPRACNILPLYVAEQTGVRKLDFKRSMIRLLQTRVDFYLRKKILVSRYSVHLNILQ